MDTQSRRVESQGRACKEKTREETGIHHLFVWRKKTQLQKERGSSLWDAVRSLEGRKEGADWEGEYLNLRLDFASWEHVIL